MNIFGLFTNKNDLSKTLFIGGLTILIFSLVYPLEKNKEISMEINEQNRNVRQFNAEMKRIDSDIENNRVCNIDSLHNVLINNKIDLDSGREKIEALRYFKHQYDLYLIILFWAGAVFTSVGFTSWCISVYREYKLPHKP